MAKRDVWKYNFAKDHKVADRIREYFTKKTKDVRDSRQPLEREWFKFYNMWNVEHDEYHLYSGRAQLYIPEVRKNVEAQARQMTESAFPNENFFDCSPGSTGTRKGSEIQKNIRRWQIEQCGLRSKYHVFARQEAMLGTSPVFVPWRKDVENVWRSKLAKKDRKIHSGREKVEIYNGPDFVVKDLFKWFAFNPKKPDILTDGCFEIYVLNEYEIRAKAKADNLVGLQDLLEGRSDAYAEEELERDVRRMEDMGLSVGSGGYAGVAYMNKDGGSEDKTFKGTLISTKINLPEAADEGEDPDSPIPVMIELINDKVTLVKRNTFWHQRPPYLVGKYILPNPDNFYGQGIPKAIQYMQYEINSKAEQAMDSATLALNPIIIVDPAQAAQTTDLTVEPGAQWDIHPDGVKMTSIPDLTSVGYQAIAQLRGQMADYSDRAPALPPQLMGKSRSATQSNIVNNAIQIDVKGFQVANEIAVLNPLMEMWESLTDQNIEGDQIIMILGNQSKQWRRFLVPKNASLGRYRYFWKLTSTIQDRLILGRSITDMLKVTTIFPPEERAQMNINYQEIFRMLWTQAYQLPDADKLFGEREGETADPELEHKMIELGVDIEVLPGDDDAEHLTKHNDYLDKVKKKEHRAILEEHLILQREQAEKKIKILQAQAQRQEQLMMMAAQEKQAGQSKGSGNRTQLSPLASSGDMASGVRA